MEILSSVILSAALKAAKETFNHFTTDKDDDLNSRIIEALETSVNNFFKHYTKYKKQEYNSFLARESNLTLITKSFFYDNDINLKTDIDRRGFDNTPDASDEEIQYFIDLLNKELSKDMKLNKIVAEKEHYELNKISSQKIDHIHSILTQSNKGEEFQFQIKNSNEKITMSQAQEIVKHKYGNDFYFDKGIFYISIEDNGTKSYYEYDIEEDAIIDSLFPYPISEYSIYYKEEDLIRRNEYDATYPDKRYSKLKLIDIKMKFGKRIKAYYSLQGELLNIEAEGGWRVNHNTRKIIPDYDKYKYMWTDFLQ